MREINRAFAFAASWLLVVCVLLLPGAEAASASAKAGWMLKVEALPTDFSSGDSAGCMGNERCDRYAVIATNVGGAQSEGPIVIKDTLAVGMTVFRTVLHNLTSNSSVECPLPLGDTIECVYEEHVLPGDTLVVEVEVLVQPSGQPLNVEDKAEVEGGGGDSVSAIAHNKADSTKLPPFGIVDFTMGAYEENGRSLTQAGGHLNTFAMGFEFANSLDPGSNISSYLPIEEPKTVTVELPLGIASDIQAVGMCPESDLPGVGGSASLCPSDSKIGTVVLSRQEGFESSESNGVSVSALYNMKPEPGYPAVFGFNFQKAPVLIYARVLPTAHGYRLFGTTPDIAHGAGAYQVLGAWLTFYGMPSLRDGIVNGSARAIFRNPTSCANGPEDLNGRMEVDSWVKPSDIITADASVYPAITGCNKLQFDPELQVQPVTTQSDTPSGYEVKLSIPQTELFSERASPDLKYASITIPPGVSLSPSAANGLQSCSEAEIDLMGTELGEGHPGGNGSPYDDGQEHASPGHCPDASKIGKVEVKTPVLSEPLKGNVYVAQPSCGGPGQPPCSETSAANGELYGIYLEVSGSGVILKLRGKVMVDIKTGQITTTFSENPQLPFEELKLTLDDGERAPLANSQTCGPETATSDLEPWSAPESGANAKPMSSFQSTGCATPMPFAPGFSAGTVQTMAGGFTPFTLSLSRNDGEQNFGGVSVTLPQGLAGMVSKVPECDEGDANAGTCPESTRIGTAHVAAGAGTEPLWLEGRVYLTGPYDGAPFGLSVVVPTKAGPFNLGDEVVRSAISIDSHTAQVTSTTEPLRLVRDGIPFRLKTINVTIDRPEFMFNPTNCKRRAVTASVTGDLPDGSSLSTASVAASFAVTGCKNLPFKPSFSVQASSRHSRGNGASIHVTVRSAPGQANVGSVHVEVPKILPSRLSTLNQACTEAQFAANPAGCPSGSFVGTATARTAILPGPISGPAIFVSHGGAAFPNLDLVLQGDGVTIVLVGDTFIDKHGVTSSTFASVPDVPIERFDVDLPEGPHSALSATGDLCAVQIVMPTVLTGQNGVQVRQQTRIAIPTCKAAIRVVRRVVHGHIATLVVSVPSAGQLLASGVGLSSASKHIGKAGNVALTLRLSAGEQRFLTHHAGRKLKVRVRLRFTPTRGRRLFAQVALLIG